MPPQSQKKEHVIKTTTFALMVAVALFYDGSQAGLDLLHGVPIIGNFFAFLTTMLIDVWAWLTFYVWFKVHGVSFASPKKGLTMAGAVIIELIPVFNALPAWTLAVVILFITTRGEEALAKTLENVAGAAGAVGKGASLAGKVAGKIPGASPALKEGLNKASEGAKKIEEGARGAREQLRNLPEDERAQLDNNTKDRKQAKQGETPPVIAGAGATEQPADIGAQPVFRQNPPPLPQQEGKNEQAQGNQTTPPEQDGGKNSNSAQPQSSSSSSTSPKVEHPPAGSVPEQTAPQSGIPAPQQQGATQGTPQAEIAPQKANTLYGVSANREKGPNTPPPAYAKASAGRQSSPQKRGGGGEAPTRNAGPETPPQNQPGGVEGRPSSASTPAENAPPASVPKGNTSTPSRTSPTKTESKSSSTPPQSTPRPASSSATTGSRGVSSGQGNRQGAGNAGLKEAIRQAQSQMILESQRRDHDRRLQVKNAVKGVIRDKRATKRGEVGGQEEDDSVSLSA